MTTTGWDIHPDGVAKVTTMAEQHQDALRGTLTRLRDHPEGGDLIGAAEITEFLRTRVQPLEWMIGRIDDVVSGTDEAVTAYENGDLEMAAEQQTFASSIDAPTPYRENTQGPLGPRRPL